MTPSRPELILGIDGGGSKTIALLADLDGRVLGRGTAGSSNYQGVGAEAAQAALSRAIRAAFAAAEVPPGPIRAACLGLAGVDRPEDRALFEAWAARAAPGVPTLIVNDAELVLAAGTPEGWGAALICGTGSIAVGRDRAGQMARAGGWGHLLGDEGSGYAIGSAALRAVTRASDGRAPQTALTAAVLSHWSLATPEDLISHVYQAHVTTPHIAALTPLVEAAAVEGDEVALGILADAGRELALAVKAVVQQLALSNPVPCALAGGVILNSRLVRQAFLEAVGCWGLQLDPVTPVTEPAQGALRLVRRSLLTG
jgi:N-acetylglucosamine kinase-like BadF-type ATPase